MSKRNRPRILLVDGHDVPRQVTSALFKLEEIEVESVADFPEAYVLLEGVPFDGFVIDPTSNPDTGLRMCRHLRDHFPQAPILFYCGSGDSTRSKLAVEAGVSAYVIKPDFDQLLGTLRSLLGETRAAAAHGGQRR